MSVANLIARLARKVREEQATPEGPVHVVDVVESAGAEVFTSEFPEPFDRAIHPLVLGARVIANDRWHESNPTAWDVAVVWGAARILLRESGLTGSPAELDEATNELTRRLGHDPALLDALPAHGEAA